MIKSFIRIKKVGNKIVVLERTRLSEVYVKKWELDSIEKAIKQLDDYEFMVGNCLMLLSVGDTEDLIGRKFIAKEDYRYSDESSVIVHKGDKLKIVGIQETIDTSSRVVYSVSNLSTKELISIVEDKLMLLIV